MRNQTFANFLLFALAGISLCFSGNLYEGIVIAPNLLTDSIRKIYHWQQFFTTTNPIYFYVPLQPIAILTTFVLYFKTSRENTALKKHIGYATTLLILVLVISIFIITQINLKLFFGTLEKYSAEIYRLSLLWNILNVIRVILLAFTIYHLFNAYLFIRKKAD